jgi:hypothetical protein
VVNLQERGFVEFLDRQIVLLVYLKEKGGGLHSSGSSGFIWLKTGIVGGLL